MFFFILYIASIAMRLSSAISFSFFISERDLENGLSSQLRSRRIESLRYVKPAMVQVIIPSYWITWKAIRT